MIGELRAAGSTVTRIDACPADIERLFVEGGPGVILMDCDPNRDTAWYGDIELQACSEPGTRLLVVDDEGPRHIPV